MQGKKISYANGLFYRHVPHMHVTLTMRKFCRLIWHNNITLGERKGKEVFMEDAGERETEEDRMIRGIEEGERRRKEGRKVGREVGIKREWVEGGRGEGVGGRHEGRKK